MNRGSEEGSKFSVRLAGCRRKGLRRTDGARVGAGAGRRASPNEGSSQGRADPRARLSKA